jgi:hypothetical protein
VPPNQVVFEPASHPSMPSPPAYYHNPLHSSPRPYSSHNGNYNRMMGNSHTLDIDLDLAQD